MWVFIAPLRPPPIIVNVPITLDVLFIFTLAALPFPFARFFSQLFSRVDISHHCNPTLQQALQLRLITCHTSGNDIRIQIDRRHDFQRVNYELKASEENDAGKTVISRELHFFSLELRL